MKVKLDLKEMELLRLALLFYMANFPRNSVDAMFLYSKLIEKSYQLNLINKK